MAHFEKDEVSMLSETCAQPCDEVVNSNFRRLVSRKSSASISVPMAFLELNEETSHFHGNLYGVAEGFGRKLYSFCSSYIPGVMDPHAKVIEQWLKIWIIFCLVANFVDPLFFFLQYVKKDDKCIAINQIMRTILVSIRSINDLVYFFNILLQFRLAYVAPGVAASRNLIDHPKKIVLNYLKSFFLIDLFVVFPLPQIMIQFVLPNYLGSSGAANSQVLAVVVIMQCLLRFIRFRQTELSTKAYIDAPAWAKDIKNFLIFMLCGHLVGSCWYLFGLQRVKKCLRNACHKSNITGCSTIIGCSFGHKSDVWNNNVNAIACLNSSSDDFSYGIYEDAIPLTTETRMVNKFVFALFWGFQQVITLGGNLTPNYKFVSEVYFTMAIMGLGLCFFVLLIGNIQSFLHTLRHRSLEMEIRGRDVEQWMNHRGIPEDLRSRVREAEEYNWASTRGVNEETLMENFPEDLQRDIRRHLFTFVKKVRLFALMDEPILDAFLERLKQKTYSRGSRILTQGCPVEEMVFVVRGILECIGEDGTRISLFEGDSCGEELLQWYLERASINADGKEVRPGQRLISNRTIRCFSNVVAFSLRLADLEDLTFLFTQFSQNPRFHAALSNTDSGGVEIQEEASPCNKIKH